MVNSMIVSWIMNFIDPKLHKSVAYVDSTQKLWGNIQKRYAVPKIPKIHMLKAEIASCKQNKQDIVDFFSKLVGLWNELDGYIKILARTCGAAAKITKLLEEDKVHQFLMGLDDEPYSVMRSQILAMDPLPSLDKIYNMVQQEEHHKSVMADRDFKTEHRGAFAVNHLARLSAMQGVKPSCRHCGKTGHEEANCFELIGYPSGWSNPRRRGGRGRNRGRCGGGRGSTGRVQGHEATSAARAQPDATASAEENHATVTASFTPEQVRLLSLI